jgi:spore coat polysaccharide biosynthesis protein SpsF
MIGVIVQARTGSTRLPGKVLLKSVGKTMLEHLMERLSYCKTPHLAIVATSIKPQDNPIAELCQKQGYKLFRGSELDVLDRHYQAARYYGLSVVVRITSDCPLIDTTLADRIVGFFMDHAGEYDLVTNRHPLTFPDGLDVDVMPISALEHVWKNATEPHQREHTIPYFWESGMRVFNVEHPDNLFRKYRWTLDYREDFELINAILEGLYHPGSPFTMDDVLAFLERQPDLSAVNARYLPS